MITNTLVYVASLAVALMLTPLITRAAQVLGLVDVPNSRKVHRQPVPRVGGVAIFLGVFLVVSPVMLMRMFSTLPAAPSPAPEMRQVLAMLASAMLIFVIGLADDVRGVSAKWKLGALLACSLACCAAGVRIGTVGLGSLHINLGWFDIPMTVLWIAAVTVGMNFMDGLDGLAAGISLIVSAGIAILSISSGQPFLAIPALALMGSLTGFLVFNFNPARVFMGDCGSLFLGFTLGASSIIAHSFSHRASGLALPAAALAVPLLDAAWTMIRRTVLQRRSVFAAERGHIHHKLIDLGLSHRQAVIVIHIITLLSALLGGWILMTHSTFTAMAAVILMGTMLYGLFRFTRSVQLRELLAALRRNREIVQRHRNYQDVFDEMQLRFAVVDNFQGWWEEICSAADQLDCAELNLPLMNRGGGDQLLTWIRPAENHHAGHEGNGNGNGAHAKANGNGNGKENSGNSREMFTATVPIRDRRIGGVVHAQVKVRVGDSLESAVKRVALLGRLMEEHSIAMLPENSRKAPAVGLTAGPEMRDMPRIASKPKEENHANRICALPSDLKVAVVHDFLYTYAGAERVLEQIIKLFPQCQLFSLFDFLPEDSRGFLQGKTVKCSFLQKLPLAKKKHRAFLPLMPLAIEQLDMSAYDLVISSSYVAAKGVITRPDQLHVCYCHSPMRSAWDLQHQYLSESNLEYGIKSVLARLILHYIRNWDARSADGVDLFLTNSDFVGRRIQKFYRRGSTTVYPPVDVEKFDVSTHREDFYLTVSRMVPYKRIGLIVEAFTKMPDKRLIVVGEGPEFNRIKAKAGPNVKLVGYQPDERVKAYMEMARAFIFAAEEDFGIVCVEAQACGTPVIAFGRGGITESILNGRTGIFFSEQTPDSLITAVHEFEGVAQWDPRRIRQNAERFAAGMFREKFLSIVEKAWIAFRARSICRTTSELLLPPDSAVETARPSRRQKSRGRSIDRSPARPGLNRPDASSRVETKMPASSHKDTNGNEARSNGNGNGSGNDAHEGSNSIEEIQR